MSSNSIDNFFEIKIIEDIDSDFKEKWVNLFCSTFKKSVKTSHLIFEKYTLNKSIFSAVFVQNELVACYSGVKMQSSKNGIQFFLSTDTMSDGTVKSASILAAQELYPYLRSLGVDIVCGYPNEKIYDIRIKRLEWSYLKNINLFIKIPFMNSDSAELTFKTSSINLHRPARHFFSIDMPYVSFYAPTQPSRFVTFFMSDKDYIKGFLNLSKCFGIGKRKFCYKVLDANRNKTLTNNLINLELTHRSIDVP